ncbi:unnamed protein product [Symbiodinium sp. CCMP2592]|nr:unnamed protein product [Symbiodinium sp. CCMP2592]
MRGRLDEATQAEIAKYMDEEGDGYADIIYDNPEVAIEDTEDNELFERNGELFLLKRFGNFSVEWPVSGCGQGSIFMNSEGLQLPLLWIDKDGYAYTFKPGEADTDKPGEIEKPGDGEADKPKSG